MPEQQEPLPINTLEDARKRLTQIFRTRRLATPALDARLLVMAACGVSHVDLIRDAEQPLTDDQKERLSAWADRRLAGEPVSRILGQRAFWGLDFQLTPETLDPRPDTETVVEAVLAALPDGDAPQCILDLGTGTGCILIALLSELPNSVGVATDISHQALIAARDNARRAGVANRCRFIQADWLNGIGGCFDVVVSNPPYIPQAELALLSPEVRGYDPTIALQGGVDGLEAYRAILHDLCRVLRPGGIAALEVGKGQAGAVVALMRVQGFEPLSPHEKVAQRDLAGIERAVLMKRLEAPQTAKKELENCDIRDSLF